MNKAEKELKKINEQMEIDEAHGLTCVCGKCSFGAEDKAFLKGFRQGILLGLEEGKNFLKSNNSTDCDKVGDDDVCIGGYHYDDGLHCSGACPYIKAQAIKDFVEKLKEKRYAFGKLGNLEGYVKWSDIENASKG